MPTHTLLPFVESPDGLGQDISINHRASIPGLGSSMTPHTASSEKPMLQSEGSATLSCMFCEHTFSHQEELGPHVLTQHPTTLFEPAVLRVEAEFRNPGNGPKSKPSSAPVKKEEVHSCVVCGQVSQDAAELESHLRKHKDYFTYCCNVCGRRFREPWFLKNHMKMHATRHSAKNRAQQELEMPATINGVTQEPASEPVGTLYKMCMICGFFFPDQNCLIEHSKVHNKEAESGKDKSKESGDVAANQESFLQSFNLVPRTAKSALKPERSSKWIPQLDPFITYQAWQLATKGKIAVGPNNTKDVGQEAATDNEDSTSDKEELSNIWSRGQADKTESQPNRTAETPEPEDRSHILRDKERPTTCEDCGRTFKTYHQLVLHSRVHKRGKGGEESPTSSRSSRASPLDHAEDGSEEGMDDTIMTEDLGPGEDYERSKVRSKKCTYCGKSFRSTYYLRIHLRTHTGEKPFKCPYCDYAAAQKTSLKYHLERHHKGKPQVEIPNTPAHSPSEAEQHKSNAEKPAPIRSKLWVHAGRTQACSAVEDEPDDGERKPAVPSPQRDGELEHTQSGAVPVQYPAPVNLKVERMDLKEETLEGPLNLSLKVSLSVPVSDVPKTATVPEACSLCAFKTIYPEVLIMHKKLAHKDKPDYPKKSLWSSLRPKRLTGCPPALNGKDVAPLPVIYRSHPRRTKSPTPQPAKPLEKTLSSSKPQVPKQILAPLPQRDTVSQAPRHKCSADPPVSQEPARYAELAKNSFMGGKYLLDRPVSADRAGIGRGAYPTKVVWPSDASRLPLSSRFGSLPKRDLGEPTTKKVKYIGAESSEKPVTRPTGCEGSTRLFISGKGATVPLPGPPTAANTLCAVTASNAAIAGVLDPEWSMMNFLHSYPPGDLAALYHGTAAAAPPSHSGLINPRAGR